MTLLIALLGAIGVPLAGVLTYWLGRRAQNASRVEAEEARAEAERLAKAAQESADRINSFDVAMASLRQSLEWSDKDRVQLRAQLETVSGELRTIQLSAMTERIKCADDIAELRRRVSGLEGKQ